MIQTSNQHSTKAESHAVIADGRTVRHFADATTGYRQLTSYESELATQITSGQVTGTNTLKSVPNFHPIPDHNLVARIALQRPGQANITIYDAAGVPSGQTVADNTNVFVLHMPRSPVSTSRTGRAVSGRSAPQNRPSAALPVARYLKFPLVTQQDTDRVLDTSVWPAPISCTSACLSSSPSRGPFSREFYGCPVS